MKRTTELLDCLTAAITTVLTLALQQSPCFLALADNDTMAACLVSKQIRQSGYVCMY